MSDERLHLSGVDLWSITFAIFNTSIQDISVLIYFFLMKGKFPRTQLTNTSQLLLILCWWNVHQAYNQLCNWTFLYSFVFWYCTGHCGQDLSRIQKPSPRYFTGNLKRQMGGHKKDHCDSCRKGKSNHCVSLKELGYHMFIYCKIKIILPRIWRHLREQQFFMESSSSSSSSFFPHLNVVLKEKETAKTSIYPSYRLHLDIFFFYWTMDGILK